MAFLNTHLIAPRERYQGEGGALEYGLEDSLPLTNRAPAQSSVLPFGQECIAVTADPCTAQEQTRWWWTNLLGNAWKTWETHALALADQAVVSAASFLTTILIARWTIPNELGLYSIGISILVSSIAIQESLISLPYTIRQHRALGTPVEHAGSSLTHCALLSALGTVILLVFALALSATNADPRLRAMIWTLTGVLPFAFLREFGRKLSLAHLRTGHALILDSAIATIQLAALCWIGWIGLMSGATACAAIGFACASASIVWLYFSRDKFAVRWSQVLTTARQSWGLGKWLFAGQIAVSVQGYMTYWLLALVIGTTETGVFAACMSIVLFANPVITGIGNIMTPRAVFALKDGGGLLLRHQMARDALLLSAVMISFCFVILFSGEDVMRLLYPGKEYDGQGHTISVLAVALLASAAGSPASNGLASLEHPRAIVWASAIGVVITGLLVWPLMVKWGLVGAAYGFLAGNVAASAGRWGAFLTLVPQSNAKSHSVPIGSNLDLAMAMRVVQQLTPGLVDPGWVVEQLDEGSQAIVYAVTSPNQRPVWQEHRSLVIKLYKPSAVSTLEVARRQLGALSRLHAAMNGLTINGWTISSPTPLHLSESPPALVMTMVPGRPLTSLLLEGADNVTPELLNFVPRAVVAAMERCWSAGQIHGDFNLDNILCDIANRTLSFVDLGLTPNFLLLGSDVARRGSSASQDLAYLLYDTGARVKSTIGNPKVRMRQQLFAESTLRAFIKTVSPFEERQQLLDNIETHTRAYLASLYPSQPRELWRLIVKKIAARRIDKILLRLKAELSCLDGSN
jgi:O-antigen/teichoic acid export membrane protein